MIFYYRLVEFNSKNLKNLRDSVSPNIDTIGFISLFARILSPWSQIGSDWIPSLILVI